MLALVASSALTFTPTTPLVRSTTTSRPALQSAPRMGVLDNVASPLRKWESSADIPAGVNTNQFSDLPFEVTALFAFIFLVGVAGLVRASGLDVGALAESAQKAYAAGRAETTGTEAPVASAPEAEAPPVPAAEGGQSSELQYLQSMAAMQKEKRGGSSDRKKKSKKR